MDKTITISTKTVVIVCALQIISYLLNNDEISFDGILDSIHPIILLISIAYIFRKPIYKVKEE